MSQREIILPTGKDGSTLYDLDAILDEAYLKPGDAAFVGGSLVEGIGNRYSDIDVHVLTDRLNLSDDISVGQHYRVLSPGRSILKEGDTGEEVFLIHTLVPGTEIKVDIEYRTYADFDQLIDRLHAIFDYAVASPMLLTKSIDHREKAFLNRMFNAISLANNDRLDTLRAKVGKDRLLYLLYRWNASDFSKLIDLVGAYEQGEMDRACDLARERLISEYLAFTHLCGNTNFNRKWLMTYGARHRGSAALFDQMRKLFLLDGYDLVAQPGDYVRATVDFVDELMFASEPYLTGSPLFPKKDSVLSRIEAEMAEEDDDYAKAEAEHRMKAYGVRGRPTWDLFGGV